MQVTNSLGRSWKATGSQGRLLAKSALCPRAALAAAGYFSLLGWRTEGFEDAETHSEAVLDGHDAQAKP